MLAIKFSSYQEFWFHLSKNEARQLPAASSLLSVGLPCTDEGEPEQLTKLGIAVYVNNISSNITAMASVPLKKLNISVRKEVYTRTNF